MGVCRTGDGTGAASGSRYVMVVDGDANELFSLSMLLQRYGYNVCTAKSAGEARELLQVAHPSLMLIAYRLPGGNGADLCRELRSDPRSAPVPLVLLTPAGDAGAERQGREAGAVRILSTPVAAEELYRAVQAVLEATPRRNIRISLALPIIMNGLSLDCKGGECATVLSEHGMYIRTLKPAVVNDQITLQFTLAGRTITADAVVLYSHTYGQGPFKEPGMGVKFVRIPAADQAAVRDYIRAAVTSGLPV